ncbi:MAG TPA: hypothetical protein DCL41_10715 [Bdellovibrionales bacterium]|mgnify:FL=1|nr:hypothetical protein [Pseudobdellovibrionaceae bacterium]HAG92338.1 hypothetical protein [Bdellovibrionales bacterium]
MTKSDLKLYRHYKNKPYKCLGLVRHSETLEELVLYESLYENELGPLWVRPKEMFFESIEVNGRSQPRFQKVEFKVDSLVGLNDEIKPKLLGLLNLVFEDFKPDSLDQKLNDKEGVILTYAFESDHLAGFKLGYRLNPTTFYSWLGAVHPDHRGIGLGKKLMLEQHRYCHSQGYKIIETKTMNKWKSMLLLNIQCGFEIYATETNDRGELKILMRKSL